MNEQEFIATVNKFRDEKASELPFVPSIERLIDSQSCKALADVFHEANGKWERRKAVPNLGQSLPRERGIYAFVWKPDFVFRFAASPEIEQLSWVLYVGKAGEEGGKNDTIHHRYVNEYSRYVGRDVSGLWDRSIPTRREERLARFLTLRPLEYWFLLVPEISDIPVLERRLIKLLQPPLNRQYGPTISPGKPVPAF